MSKRKERCPNCGSKKIIYGEPKKCKVCGLRWSGKPKRKTAKKDKVRFR